MDFPEISLYNLYEFLRSGEDPDTIDEVGNSILHYSIENPAIVELLLKYGASPNIKNPYGITPLHVASTNDDYYTSVEKLLEYGANPNARNFYYRTPLHIACREGNIGIIEKLVEYGGNLALKDKDGLNPILYGCSTNQAKMEYISNLYGLPGCTPNYLEIKEEREKHEECPICYENNGKFVKLPCNHVFCKKCIDKWADRTCPFCREKYFGIKKLKRR